MALASIPNRNIIERTNMDQSPSQGSRRQRQPPIARSQSIKILRNNSTSHSHCNGGIEESAIKAWEEDVSILEEQYEAATIQMYYRITEYRMRNSSLYLNTAASSTTPSSQNQFGLPLPATITMRSNANTEDPPATNATYISEENGAIFEMDL